jgi:hypothetical protein
MTTPHRTHHPEVDDGIDNDDGRAVRTLHHKGIRLVSGQAAPILSGN